jgi:hypothetical protein
MRTRPRGYCFSALSFVSSSLLFLSIQKIAVIYYVHQISKPMYRDLGFGTNSHLDAGNVKNMVMDVYNHPSKYVQAIRQMMNTYNLEHK